MKKHQEGVLLVLCNDYIPIFFLKSQEKSLTTHAGAGEVCEAVQNFIKLVERFELN